MNERLDPEEVQAILGRIKAEAVRIVEGRGGIVNQFVGDEVIALFGIPTAHEDDPVRAVRASLALHDLVRDLSTEVEAQIGQSLRMHTGINTGLIVTHLEDERDGRYGLTGDTVNTGARLLAQAETDTILISPDTNRLIAPYFETEALDPVEMKGKAETMVPHRVKGEKRFATRFDVATARGLTPFVGRIEELYTLHRALDKAQAGEGQFLTVIGEAGIGKSRLIYEFRHSINREEVTVLEGRCQSYGIDTPYMPFLDALRRGLQLHEEDSPEALHEKAVANILAIDTALERNLPHLLHLLSIPSDSHKLPETLQGDALRRELEEALVGTFTQSTRHGPMVVLFEDWHWADEASDKALQHLTNLVGHHPLLLLILYRPEYTRAWGEMAHHTSLVLKSLDVANTEGMLGSVLGAGALPRELGAHVHACTGGNALFNEEVARSLIEENIVIVNNGVATLSRSTYDLQLPDSVKGVIRARVDHLDPDSREVLRLASVIGREFARSVLERLYPSSGKLDQALAILRRQDLVQELRVVPQAEYAFKHTLTQTVVYETLLRQRRQELHARVGLTIESLYADRLEEQYEALAYHFSQSDDHKSAIKYRALAGDKAAGYYSLEEARKHYESEIVALRQLI